MVHLGAAQALALALEATVTRDATREQLVQGADQGRRAETEGREYLRLYARHVDDRGDQGMLVSYHYNVVRRAQGLREELEKRAARAPR